MNMQMLFSNNITHISSNSFTDDSRYGRSREQTILTNPNASYSICCCHLSYDLPQIKPDVKKLHLSLKQLTLLVKSLNHKKQWNPVIFNLRNDEVAKCKKLSFLQELSKLKWVKFPKQKKKQNKKTQLALLLKSYELLGAFSCALLNVTFLT